jgi:hypothetical protein
MKKWDPRTYQILIVPYEEFMVVSTNQRSSRDTVKTPSCEFTSEAGKLAVLRKEPRKNLFCETLLIDDDEGLATLKPTNALAIALIRNNLVQFEREKGLRIRDSFIR